MTLLLLPVSQQYCRQILSCLSNAPCTTAAYATRALCGQVELSWRVSLHALQLRELCRRTSQLLQEQPLRVDLNASKTLLRKKHLKWLWLPA